MQNFSIIERLEEAALNGKFSIVLCLWKRTINSLRKQGLNVNIINQVEKARYVCKITWDNSSKNIVPNNLYIMATNAASNNHS